MDPNACLERFITALDGNDIEEACIAQEDLTTWLGKGGFEPNWTSFKRNGSPVTKEWFLSWVSPDAQG